MEFLQGQGKIRQFYKRRTESRDDTSRHNGHTDEQTDRRTLLRRKNTAAASAALNDAELELNRAQLAGLAYMQSNDSNIENGANQSPCIG